MLGRAQLSPREFIRVSHSCLSANSGAQRALFLRQTGEHGVSDFDPAEPRKLLLEWEIYG